MTFQVAPLDAGEVEEFAHAVALPFGETVHGEDVNVQRTLLEVDRAFAVRDGGRIVATSANLSMTLSVPGGAPLPMAGVTAVAVWPSHRRRGLAAQLIGTLHRDARERGEPVAGLWASESKIYGRFGYGNAATMANLRLDTAHAAFARPVDTRGAVRIVEPEEAVGLLLDLYARERLRTPGMPSLDEPRARAFLAHDPEHRRGGASRRYLAAVGDRGLVTYRVRERWRQGIAGHQVQLGDLYAADRQAWALLWRYLCDLDLVSEVVAHGRPVDEPLRHLLVDPRRLRSSVLDSLWLRVLDVAGVLSGRAYACDGAVRVEVVDEAGFAAGRWVLEARDGKGQCTATTAEPDLTLPVDSLGAACLGGTRLTALARAGRAQEHTPGSLRHLDLMLSSDPLPWCPFDF